MEETIQNIIDTIKEIQEDGSIPKNVMSKLQEVNEILKAEEEKSIKVDKALNVLDDLAEDANIQAYTRTQIWNVISALETA